jgi:phosphoribosylamine--glycine ligase/phosphoribosylaminoimidazole synthetase
MPSSHRPVLVVGGGGREHALARSLSRASGVSEVVVAPGNGGTHWPASSGIAACRSAAVSASDIDALLALAGELKPRMVVVGPEVPLAAGLADRLTEAGIACFGPTAAAAELEASKAFAKSFMERHHIPTAEAREFIDADIAKAWVNDRGVPMVVKASGLAAGKGVVVPDSVEGSCAAIDLILGGAFGTAGDSLIVEERLSGDEVSVLAFTDGTSVAVMPPAQDHKRIGEGDSGPNTGGMGAYAPAPALKDIDAIVEQILLPAGRGMAAEDRRFVGVLYAGLMMTEDGPKVLEFNCRFGDPETQVLLPLLDTDLLRIFDACVNGTLDTLPVRWKAGSALTVVAASPGYPASSTKGLTISGADTGDTDATILFHAGTRAGPDGLETAGGRVLSVTGLGETLRTARNQAYARLDAIDFEGKQVRRDIGHRALSGLTYAQAGVSLEAGAEVVSSIKDVVRETHGPEVLAGVGAFGGMFSAMALKGMDHPVLVASTDGVGTKTRIATQVGRVGGLGHDLVNHCINDILVQGARPLFFLDYVASSRLVPEQVADFVRGAAEACKATGCALLGGETAEMPGVYMDGELDVVGTIVGVVDRGAVIDGSTVSHGDVLIGLVSTGLHTNGYSLARRIIDGLDLTAHRAVLNGSLADALLQSHCTYLAEVDALRGADIPIHALAHITGGGLPENLPRVLPAGLRARIDTQVFKADAPPIFDWLVEAGGVERLEAFRAFNMGVGMVVVVPADRADAALTALSQTGLATAWRIGSIESAPGIEKGSTQVELIG